MVESTIFWIFAILAVVAGIGVVTHRSIVYASLFLILVFTSNAAFFILNNADFLAISQILVYAVGLTIILLFAVMFTGDQPFSRKDSPVPVGTRVASFIVVAYIGALLLRSIQYPFTQRIIEQNTTAFNNLILEGTSKALGLLMFQNYTLPFELASLLLLIAMIGAILMSKKQFELPSQHDELKFAVDTESDITDDARRARFGEPTTPTPQTPVEV